MRVLVLFVAIFFSHLLQAQTPFQGKVVYVLKAEGEKKDAELSIYFAPNKIKMRFREDADYNKNYTLIDLDSGKVYYIDEDEKTFRVRKLFEEQKPGPVLDKSILGHQTTAVAIPSGAPSVLKGMASGAVVFYISKEHYFPVPQKYAGAPELMVVQKNYIVLGGTLTAGNPFADFEEDEGLEKGGMAIIAEAKEILPAVYPGIEFRVPEGYSRARRHNYDYTDSTVMLSDTTTIAVDSVFVQPPAPKPKQKPAPKKTTQVKGEAAKRKKT